MNGGLDPEYESPENKVKKEIRWIDRKLEGQYTAEYKEQLRLEKIALIFELIKEKGELSKKDIQELRNLFTTKKWWEFLIFWKGKRI